MLATVEYAAPVLVVVVLVVAAGEALVMTALVEPAVGEVGVVRALVIVIPEAEEAETEGERDKDRGEDREEGTEEDAEEDAETELEATPPV